jgi:hypothetical protein
MAQNLIVVDGDTEFTYDQIQIDAGKGKKATKPYPIGTRFYFAQGALTEGEGSVRLTSLYQWNSML